MIISAMPFGQIPVLEVDGEQIAQSTSIARFLSKEFGLAGKDHLQQAQADMVVDTCNDVIESKRSFYNFFLFFFKNDFYASFIYFPNVLIWGAQQEGSIKLRIGPLSNNCRCQYAFVDKNSLFSLRQASLRIGPT